MGALFGTFIANESKIIKPKIIKSLNPRYGKLLLFHGRPADGKAH